MNFLFDKGYHEKYVKFAMPKIEDGRRPVLSAEEAEKLVKVADKREKDNFPANGR